MCAAGAHFSFVILYKIGSGRWENFVHIDEALFFKKVLTKPGKCVILYIVKNKGHSPGKRSTMNTNAILIALIARYESIAFTNNYIMGFTYKGAVYAVTCTGLRFGMGGFQGRRLAQGDMLPLRSPVPDLPDLDRRRLISKPASAPTSTAAALPSWIRRSHPASRST